MHQTSSRYIVRSSYQDSFVVVTQKDSNKFKLAPTLFSVFSVSFMHHCLKQLGALPQVTIVKFSDWFYFETWSQPSVRQENIVVSHLTNS